MASYPEVLLPSRKGLFDVMLRKACFRFSPFGVQRWEFGRSDDLEHVLSSPELRMMDEIMDDDCGGERDEEQQREHELFTALQDP